MGWNLLKNLKICRPRREFILQVYNDIHENMVQVKNGKFDQDKILFFLTTKYGGIK